MDDGQKTVLDAYRDMKQQVGEVCQLIAVSLQSWFAAAKQRQQPQPQKVSVPAPQEQQPMESVSTPQPPIQPQERPQQPQKEVSVTPQTQQQQQLSQQEVSVSPPQAQAQRQVNKVSDAPPKMEPQPQKEVSVTPQTQQQQQLSQQEVSVSPPQAQAQRQVNKVSDAPQKMEPQPRQQSETQANPSVREKGTIPSGVVNLPTPEEEAAILYRAFTGRGCDVGRLLRVLTQRDATHRQLIRQQYRKNYGEELSDRIEVTMASYTYKNANAAPARPRPQQKPQGLGQRESQERYPMDSLSLANVGYKFVKTVADTEPEVYDQGELDDQLDEEVFDENDDRGEGDEDYNEDEEEDADDPTCEEWRQGQGQREFQERAISLWLMVESERDATIVWQSLQRKSLDKAALNEVICSRTPSQIRNLKRAYFTYFKSKLSKDITYIFVIDRNTKELLVACLDDKARDEGTNVDVNKAKEDATQLYKDGEQKMWGTNNKTFIDIFAKRSRPHLAAVDAAYDKLYGHSLEEAVRKETSRSFMAGLLTLLKCAKNPAKYFAEVLYNSMKGLGTSDTTLIRVVVTRAGIDMEDIKKEYEQAYKTSLKDCIHNDTSGDYRTFLLNLLE
ncbi:hypothetical protein MRB53_008599 [Persea americana]|uniref:Uncharacterized protein n=1 Tax=Persea americana TaxID=3435 RepID=A0ACC2MN51_PERAE|nr:hypothetical protein MRB53_008599 [Persea americana]